MTRSRSGTASRPRWRDGVRRIPVDAGRSGFGKPSPRGEGAEHREADEVFPDVTHHGNSASAPLDQCRSISLLLEEKVASSARRMRWKGYDHLQRRQYCLPNPTTPHPARRTAAPPSPQGEGIARGNAKISSEAGLAPSGSPAAQFHSTAASFLPKHRTNPRWFYPSGVRSIERRI